MSLPEALKQSCGDCKVVLGHDEHGIAETLGFVLHAAQATVRSPDASHENVSARTASAHEPTQLRVIPHGPMDHAERWRLAQAFTRPALTMRANGEGGDLPDAFAPLQTEGAGVLVTALYRETEDRGFGVQRYAGANLGHPYVFRLVEFDGRPAPVRLDLVGKVAAAYKTNLLGEIEAELVVERIAESSRLQLILRPYEIATLYLDLVEGRKTNRDLDARRSVWAQVHRTGESQ